MNKEAREYAARELPFRIQQFASVIDLPTEKLQGLKFCSNCNGVDYNWTDYTRTEIDPHFGIETEVDAYNYRMYLLESICTVCEGTGFNKGSWNLTQEDWLKLSQQ